MRLTSDADADDIERLLDDLQRESDERRRELLDIAASLPGDVSRRALLRSIAVDFRRAPNKRQIASRAARKLARTPLRAYRIVRHQLRHRDQ